MRLLLLLVLFLLEIGLNAQVYFHDKANDRLEGAKTLRLDEQSQMPQFIELSAQLKLPTDEGLGFLKKVGHLTDRTCFAFQRTETCKLDIAHDRYQQLVDNHTVVGGEYIFHHKNGLVNSMNGELFPESLFETTFPLITKAYAKQIAFDIHPATLYAWDVPHPITGQPYVEEPEVELVWVPEALDFKRRDFKLAYKVEVFTMEPHQHKMTFYIDAIDASIVAEEHHLCSVDVEGVAHTVHSGIRNIITDQTDPNRFRLRESGRGIITMDLNWGIHAWQAVDYTDFDNLWDPISSGVNKYAVDCHWAAEVYYDLLQTFGRNSIDDAGITLESYLEYGNNTGNAFWNGVGSFYGTGGSGSLDMPTGTIDIVGHEFTHGLVDYTANLIYKNDSGALNESFADIFGHLTDIFGRGMTESAWIIGDEATSSGLGIRNFIDPSFFDDPDTYQGDHWKPANGADNGGVHSNSMVQNHWFYLLVTGGTGVNDNGDTYAVEAMGHEVASEVAYRNLSVYLTAISDYPDAAFYAELCAMDLYGSCSEEIIAVNNAWHAVGLGQPLLNEFNLSAITNEQLHCALPAVVSFYNTSSLIDSVFWDFGDGYTSTELSPVHIYTENGNYDVTLSGTSCSGEVATITYADMVQLDTEAAICDTIVMGVAGSITLDDCVGHILDSGGREDYISGTDFTVHLAPGGELPISLTLLEFEIEYYDDYLFVYDGPSINSPLLAVFGGSDPEGAIITSTGPEMTIRFKTDLSVQHPGFLLGFSVEGGNQLPIATFEISNDNPAINEPIEMTNTGSPLIGNFDFGDGLGAIASSTSHAYSNSGGYLISHILGNCAGNDTVTVPINVQLPGKIKLTPDSICVTLNAGESITESVQISNLGLGDLYFEFAQDSIELEEQESTLMYNGNPTTQHTFEIPEGNLYSMDIIVVLNGNFDDIEEYANLIIEGVDLGIIDDGNIANGTDIIANYSFTAPEFSDWLSDGVLDVQVANSSEVSAGFGGIDVHTVKVKSYIDDWEAVIPNSGVVATSESAIIDVKLDATGLIEGDYIKDVAIIHSDTSIQNLSLPIKMTVIGTPEISVSPSFLDFDNVYTNLVATDTLLITNTGTSELLISGISIANTGFSTNSTSLAIPPFASQQVVVAFAPLASGDYNTELVITSNAGNVNVPITASSTFPPILEISPDSLCVTVPAGTVVNQDILITNAGQSDLEWNITGLEYNEPIEIVTWVYGQNVGIEYTNTISAIDQYFTNYNLTEVTTYSANDLAAALVDADLLLLPNILNCCTSTLNAAAPVVQSYLNNGGSLISLMEGSYAPLMNLGLIDYDLTSVVSSSQNNLVISNPDHPIMEGVDNSLTAPNSTSFIRFSSDSPDVEVLVENTSADAVVFTYPFGAGRVVHLGFNYFEYNDESAKLLANSIAFLERQSIPDWQTISAEGGTLAAADNQILSFEFDATDLLSGVYDYELDVFANDPLTSSFPINIKMIVTGIPEITVSPESIELGEIFTSVDYLDTLCITNPGTDTLLITNISYPNSVVSFSTTNLSIPPLDTAKVILTIDESSSLESNQLIKITNNAENIVVPLSFNALTAPSITIDPASICITMLAGTIATETLTIDNTGEADLNYELGDAGGNPAMELLVWTYGVDMENEYINTIAGLNQYYANYNLTIYAGANMIELSSHLQNADALLIPKIEGGSPSVFLSASSIVQDFLIQGKGVVVLREHAYKPLERLGLVDYINKSTISPGTSLNVFVDNTPVANQIPNSYFNSDDATTIDDTDPLMKQIVIDPTSNQTLVGTKDWGAGRIVYVGFDFNNYNEVEANLLANSVKYASGKLLPNWLSIDPPVGSLGGNSSAYIDVVFNTNGLYAGVYDYIIGVNSNVASDTSSEVVVKLIVEATPIANFATNLDGNYSCNGIVDFIDASANIPTSWSWGFGDGGTSSEQNPSYIYTQSGFYSVTLEACNALGCTEFTQSIQVELEAEFCEEVIMESSGSTTVTACTGTIYDDGGADGDYTSNSNYTVFIEQEEGNIIDLYVLSFQLESCCDYLRIYDGPAISSPLLGHFNSNDLSAGSKISSSGNFMTIVFHSDSNVNFSGFEFQWKCTGELPFASFSPNIDTDCGNTVEFISDSPQADSHFWQFGDGYTSTEINPTHAYAVPWSYTAILTITNSNGEDTRIESVVIEDIAFTLELEEPDEYFVNEPFTLSTGALVDIVAYEWIFDNIISSDLASPSFVFLSEGQHTISLRVTDINGCQAYLEKQINVVPTSVTNHDLVNNYQVFPNPTSSTISIDLALTSSIDFELSLYNIIGQKVYQYQPDVAQKDWTHNIDIGAYPSGTYWLVLKSAEGQLLVTEAIVKR